MSKNAQRSEIPPALAVEARIVRKLCRELKKAGYLPDSVWDSQEYVKAHTESEVLKAVFAVDEATIHFDRGAAGKNGKSHGVFIVLGNGVDCMSDWHVSDKYFDAAVSRVSAETDDNEQ
jgi:ATP-dependent Lon protease